MSIDTASPRSRRMVLAAAIGGVTGLVAHTLGRPGTARAATGDTMILGQFNDADSETRVRNTAGGAALSADANAGTGIIGRSSSGDGIEGSSDGAAGVFGRSSSPSVPAILGQAQGGGIGVEGYVGTDLPQRVTGIGVSGVGPTIGVRGLSGGTIVSPGGDGFGVFGAGSTNGVRGHSSAGAGVHGDSVTGSGVQGHSDQGIAVAGDSFTGVGVSGFNGSGGTGVRGSSTDGTGVHGFAMSGTAVHAVTDSGTAVLAESPLEGVAIDARGPVKFTAATVETIPPGLSNLTVSPGFDLTAQSKVLCTFQSDPGPVSIRYVAVNHNADAYTIFLTAKVRTQTSIACFVIG